jgi:hypothetical protein
LLEAKIKQAEMQMRETLNTQLVLGTVSSATFVQDTAEDGSYGLNPLGYFFRLQKATDPTTNDVGNIPGDTYSWWRHRTADLGANAGSTMSNEDFALNCTTFAGLKVGLRRLYNYCSRGLNKVHAKPSLIDLEVLARTTGGKRKGSLND